VTTCIVEIQSNSADFAKSYKDLVKVRINLKKAVEAYEKKMQAYNNSLANYFVVEEEMVNIKKKLEEVCMHECTDLYVLGDKSCLVSSLLHTYVGVRGGASSECGHHTAQAAGSRQAAAVAAAVAVEA
jgi:hypothetical protein